MAFAVGARYTIFTNDRMQPGDEGISIRISIIVTAFVPPSATKNNAIPNLIWRSSWTTPDATLVAHITFVRDAFASTKFYYHARIVPRTSREIRSSDHHPLVARTFFFCICSGPLSRSKKARSDYSSYVKSSDWNSRKLRPPVSLWIRHLLHSKYASKSPHFLLVSSILRRMRVSTNCRFDDWIIRGSKCVRS